MNHFFAALGIILAGGVLPLLVGRRPKAIKAMGTMGIVAGCLLGVIHVVTGLSGGGAQTASYRYLHTFDLAFRLDGLAAFFLVAIFSICGLAALYSYHYMDDENRPGRTAAHYLLFALLTVSMALVVTANNMLAFAFAWEIMSLSSFFLVIHNHEEEANRRAGLMYLIFSQVGAMFLFTAFGVIYAHTGSLSFAGLAALPEDIKLGVFCLAFVGLGSKAGVFPLHFWLPHAHPAAPSHISAVMSGVMIKVGIYGILRMYLLLDWQSLIPGYILLIAGILSGVLGVVYALGQHDLKRLLAYHSVENIGIILMGLGLGMIGAASGQPTMAVLGFCGGLLHVLNHAIFKSLLFMGAGMVLHKTRSRRMDQMGGLLKKMKVTGTTFIIGSVAIAGLPPLNGFVSELLVFLSGFQGLTGSRSVLLLSLLAIVSLAVIGGLALACFSKVVGVVFQGEPRSEAAASSKESGVTMLIPMIGLAGACLVIGVYPDLFIRLARNAVLSVGLAQAPSTLEHSWQLASQITRGAAIFFGLTAVLWLLRSLLYRGKTVTRAGTWGCGFTQPTTKMQYTASSYADDILRLFKNVAPKRVDHPPIEGRFPAATHYHSEVEDLAEGHVGPLILRPVHWILDKLRWIQHGDIHLYIGYILLTIVVLLFFI